MNELVQGTCEWCGETTPVRTYGPVSLCDECVMKIRDDTAWEKHS